VRAKAKVFSSSVAGNMGSNPAEGIDVRLLWLLCVAKAVVYALS